MPAGALDEVMIRASAMYYVENKTMEAIARELAVSRSTVSRLLKRARAEGVVEIVFHLPDGTGSPLASRLKALFGVETYIVGSEGLRGSEFATLERVAGGVGRMLPAWLSNGSTVGVAWGTTMAAVARQVSPVPLGDVRFVQLNGAGNAANSGLGHAGETLSRLAAAFGGSVLEFPVPAFFDYAATRQAMWRERSVRRVLDAQARADIALFSVGSFGGELPSQVYAGGYLDQRDKAELARQQVVGDVCTVFLRADGSYDGIGMNERASGPPLSLLKTIPRRVCVVAAKRKAVTLLAALRAGLVTDLVLDQATARAVEAMVTQAHVA